ncbi:MAG: 4Fe-4S dicluster domain-containing protein [Rhodanobacteraceae bacterium]
MRADSSLQQPCTHCGGCARACPESLDPEGLFFALVDEDWTQVRQQRLEACTECNRCAEACPSHIPLLDWLRWGNGELAMQERAERARTRFLARNARLARECADRAADRVRGRTDSRAAPAPQTISKSEVLAAIARGRAKRVRSSRIVAAPDGTAAGPARKS